VRLAYLFRAQIYLVLGRRRDGIENLNEFFVGSDRAFDPKSPDAAGRRGRQLRLIANELPPSHGKQQAQILKLARTELLDATREMGTAACFADLGRVSEQLGQTDDAIKAYGRALELEPKDLRILSLRGWAFVNHPEPQLDRARADFVAALAIAANDPDSHAGLGYVQASKKVDVEARREAQLAALYGSGDYMMLHNVACVFAKLSDVMPAREKEYHDLAIDYLRRAVELWKRDRTGPNEQTQIQRESAFSASLRKRPEFKELLKDPTD
jgi:tetratricopeptide (TPR) repeat protein